MRSNRDSTRASSTRPRAAEHGFSVLEALISLFFLTVIALSVARMIGVGVVVNRASEDTTITTSLAEQKMEELRSMAYPALPVGGSLVADNTGFFEEIDADGDARPEYRLRWQITDSGVSKMIRVYAVSELDVIGDPKETSLAYLMAAQ